MNEILEQVVFLLTFNGSLPQSGTGYAKTQFIIKFSFFIAT